MYTPIYDQVDDRNAERSIYQLCVVLQLELISSLVSDGFKTAPYDDVLTEAGVSLSRIREYGVLCRANLPSPYLLRSFFKRSLKGALGCILASMLEVDPFRCGWRSVVSL